MRRLQFDDAYIFDDVYTDRLTMPDHHNAFSCLFKKLWCQIIEFRIMNFYMLIFLFSQNGKYRKVE